MKPVLRNNMLTARAAFGSGPQGRFRAERSAVSILPCAPLAMFGRFGRNQLVQGLAFGAAH